MSDYREARDAQDRSAIADAIQRRFTERYVRPVALSRHKHGFALMAVSCLMIEALESFRQGWEDSRGKSETAFLNFFTLAEAFGELRGRARDFYRHVRCGILHQAETTGGWVIRRSGPLFDSAGLTINATKFVEALEGFLAAYCDQLKRLPWESPEWKHVIKKMDAVAKNCQADPRD